MAYSLPYHNSVKRALRDTEGLSRAGRVKLFTNLDECLRDHGDKYRNDPALRLAPGSTCFWFYFTMLDPDGPRRAFSFAFVVDDAAAAFGVLQIVYVEVRPGTA